MSSETLYDIAGHSGMGGNLEKNCLYDISHNCKKKLAMAVFLDVEVCATVCFVQIRQEKIFMSSISVDQGNICCECELSACLRSMKQLNLLRCKIYGITLSPLTDVKCSDSRRFSICFNMNSDPL